MMGRIGGSRFRNRCHYYGDYGHIFAVKLYGRVGEMEKLDV